MPLKIIDKLIDSSTFFPSIKFIDLTFRKKNE